MLRTQSFYKLNSLVKFTARRVMAQYKVLSSTCSLGNVGDIIDSANDTTINYDALIDGEHIMVINEVKQVAKKDAGV